MFDLICCIFKFTRRAQNHNQLLVTQICVDRQRIFYIRLQKQMPLCLPPLLRFIHMGIFDIINTNYDLNY